MQWPTGLFHLTCYTRQDIPLGYFQRKSLQTFIFQEILLWRKTVQKTKNLFCSDCSVTELYPTPSPAKRKYSELFQGRSDQLQIAVILQNTPNFIYSLVIQLKGKKEKNYGSYSISYIIHLVQEDENIAYVPGSSKLITTMIKSLKW